MTQVVRAFHSRGMPTYSPGEYLREHPVVPGVDPGGRGEREEGSQTAVDYELRKGVGGGGWWVGVWVGGCGCGCGVCVGVCGVCVCVCVR